MIFEPSPYAHLKVVRLADVERVPAALGLWVAEEVEAGDLPELSAGGIYLELVTNTVKPGGGNA